MVPKVLVIILLMVAIDQAIGAWPCSTNCWKNNWRKRDSESRNHGMYNIRCSYKLGGWWGGTCYCYGPPKCSGAPAFTCAANCWHNNWRHRDQRARAAGQYNKRCSYGYHWGGRCYCYGAPGCVKTPLYQCARNCWHNNWRHRDQRARAAGQYNKRCSYGYHWGGLCYCYGSPIC